MLPVIAAHNLSKRYRLGTRTHRFDRLTELISLRAQKHWNWMRGRSRVENRREQWIWGLDNVSFEVTAGEVIGIMGPNGAGKSTLLKVLSRITDPTSGCVRLRGRASSLLEVGTGFHPDLTGRENIFLNGSILGMPKAEVRAKLDEIVDFSEIEDYLDTPVKRYSSGMFVRLAFAVAAHLEPEILIVDEVLAVGDMAFQKKCLGKMEDVSKQGRTVLLVSHNLATIKHLCQRGIVLRRGKLAFDGIVKDAIDFYANSVFGEGSTSDLGMVDLRVTGRRAPEFRIPFLEGLGIYAEDGFALKTVLPYGAPLQIRVDCRLRRPVRHVDVLLSFNSLLDEAIFVANSGFDPNCANEEVWGERTFICDIPSFSLVPGDYMVNVSLVVRGIWIDCVDDAARFSVMASDHYGTGRVPKHGRCVLPHGWTTYSGRSLSIVRQSKTFEAMPEESESPIRVLSASVDLGVSRTRVMLLRQFGFDATFSESKRHALELIEKKAFDVLVFGSALSRDTGWELAGVFRTHNSKGKIIEIIPTVWTATRYRPDATVLDSDEANRLPETIHSMFA